MFNQKWLFHGEKFCLFPFSWTCDIYTCSAKTCKRIMPFGFANRSYSEHLLGRSRWVIIVSLNWIGAKPARKWSHFTRAYGAFGSLHACRWFRWGWWWHFILLLLHLGPWLLIIFMVMFTITNAILMSSSARWCWRKPASKSERHVLLLLLLFPLLSVSPAYSIRRMGIFLK